MPNPHVSAALPSLSDTALPGRVRELLSRLLNTASEAIAPRLNESLEDFSRQLFGLASHVASPGMESGYLHSLGSLQSKRTDVVPHFMARLEAGLAELRSPTALSAAVQAADDAWLRGGGLSLVDDAHMDMDTLAVEMVHRHGSRGAQQLHMLGQRLGVLAGSPALEPDRNPLGPAMTVAHLRAVAERLELQAEAELLLLRCFDRQMTAHYTRILDVLNDRLRDDGVLPHLGFAGVRPRGSRAAGRRPEPFAGDRAASPAGMPSRKPEQTPFDDRNLPPPAGARPAASDSAESMQALHAMLHAYRQRQAHAPPASATAATDFQRIDSALNQLQSAVREQALGFGMAALRQQLLTRLQQEHGVQAGLSEQHADALDLLDILLQQIGKDLAPESRSAVWVQQLQVPLLRVALHDPTVFANAQHPARQLLGAVAEAGARWLGPEDVEPALLRTLQEAVDLVQRNYDGDIAVFETGNQALQRQLRDQQRKAQLAERRHVEAARGQEKLAIARLHAAEVLEQAIGQRELEPFLRALLEQAWADVLTLTLLRHGEESVQWRQRVEGTHRIVEIAAEDPGESDPALAGRIESALASVGYHAEEAAVIARRLAGGRPSQPDAAQQAAITAQLQAKARLGENLKTAHAKTAAVARSEQEEASYRKLRSLAFGTAIDMPDEDGRTVRRRMAWFSTVTDTALFVNARGQRVGEQSLDSVARLIAAGKAAVVTESDVPLVDRAWQATLNKLRSLSPRTAAAPAASQEVT